MLLTSGIAALLGIALVGAKTPLPEGIHKEPPSARDHSAQALRSPFSPRGRQASNIIPGMYLVEFSDGHDNASFFTSMHANGIQPIPRMDLNFTLFKGASFRINDTVVKEHTQVSMIAAMPAVKQMWPLRNYTIPNTQRKNFMYNPNASITRLDDMPVTGEDSFAEDKTKDKFSTHVMTQVDKLHAEGKTGEGVRIGIVDTGVDYTHPALGGCFGNKKNCVVKYGYDLVGDDWDGYANPQPDDDPFDQCVGHGTHVTGIIAAQPNELNFTGVAPGAILGMYRVFSCVSWGTADDTLIAAFNMAFEDGSDIITASIGGISGWSEVPWSVVVSRIVAEGVPCTLAAGNAGYYGLFAASDAADGTGVTAVASFDNAVTPNLLPKAVYRATAKGSHIADISAQKGVSFGWEPSFPYFLNVTLPLLALSNDSSVPADACKKLPEDTPDLAKYAVLIRLGGCDAHIKALNVIAKGAANIVFYAATENLELPRYELWDPFSDKKPLNGSGTVTAATGAAWVELLNSGEQVQVTFTEPQESDVAYMEWPNTLTGGFASSFTSWGPTWELAVYPTIGAPGGSILSTYPMNMGGYAIDSGTSMATPFTAGVLALIKQVRNATLTPGELDSLISSTSKANFWNDGGGSLRDLAPVSQQGPGLIQAYDAAYATTLVSRSSIAFNDTDHSPGAVEFTLSNEGDDTVTYELENVPALGMYMLTEDRESYAYDTAYFPNPIFAASSSLNFSNTTLSLKPKARAILSVIASPPTNDEGMLSAQSLPVYSGYISINGSDGSNLTIPYMGLAGSLYDAVNLDPRSTNLGCSRAYYSTEAPYCIWDNASFTLPYPTGQLEEYDVLESYGEYPTVSVRLSLASALVRVDVLPLSKNFTGPTTMVVGIKSAGSIYGWPMTYLDRSEYEIGFNGMLADGSIVPEGEYGLFVRVLRLFGDPTKEHDYSTVQFVPFSLHYDNNTEWPGSGSWPPKQKGLPLLS